MSSGWRASVKNRLKIFSISPLVSFRLSLWWIFFWRMVVIMLAFDFQVHFAEIYWVCLIGLLATVTSRICEKFDVSCVTSWARIVSSGMLLVYICISCLSCDVGFYYVCIWLSVHMGIEWLNCFFFLSVLLLWDWMVNVRHYEMYVVCVRNKVYAKWKGRKKHNSYVK